jgi:drug/metabolite transporter (DMT)-like permease
MTTDIPGPAWAAVGFLAVGATVIAFLLYNYALRHLPAGVAGLAVNGVPVVTTITGRLFLGEQLTALQLVGAAVVIGAVTWVATSSERAARPSPLRIEG